MQSVPDPYRILGLRRAATSREVRAAHRRLAKRYHPDAPGGDTARFLAVQAAYQLLVDPERRREWDARHAPGPVRADVAPARRSRSGRRGGEAAEPEGRASDLGARRQGSTPRARPRAEPPAGRDPTPPGDEGTQARGARTQAGGARTQPDGSAPPTEAANPVGMDAYVRSSGAAWSAASRAYFRRAAADLPRGTRMGHSAWTGRVGWEPPADEILRASGGPAPEPPAPEAPDPDQGGREAGRRDGSWPDGAVRGRRQAAPRRVGALIDRLLGRRAHAR
jgi:curved DNA-binding protein CbpA